MKRPLPTYFRNIEDFDGNIYTSVIIDTQEWLVENLKTTHYNDGTPILNLVDDGDWSANTVGVYCWYNNDILNETPYGALYSWNAVNNVHGLAISGWSIPSKNDWEKLITYLGGNLVAGGKLKEEGTTHWQAPNWLATNEYGFTSVGGGFRSMQGGIHFEQLKQYGLYWTNTESGLNAWLNEQTYSSANNQAGNILKSNGLSVRCMRDV